MAVDCSNVNLVRNHFLHLFLQLILGAEGLISDINVIFKREGKFTVLEVVFRHCKKQNYVENMKMKRQILFNINARMEPY